MVDHDGHDILGVHVDDLSDSALEERVRGFLQGDAAKTIVTPNPEFVLSALDDAEFRSILSRADLSLPDGAGLAYAVAALFDAEVLRHRRTGVQMFDLLARLAREAQKRFLILGGTAQEQDLVSKLLKEKYPGLDVVSCDPGIIDDEMPRLSEATVAQLKMLEPAVIAVALGQGRGRAQGKQEKIMEFLKRELPTARVLIGVGGTVHMLANPHLRAPEWLRKRGLEWAWRFLKQPWRSKRMFRALVVFPAEVVWATLRTHRFLKATKNVFIALKKGLRAQDV